MNADITILIAVGAVAAESLLYTYATQPAAEQAADTLKIVVGSAVFGILASALALYGPAAPLARGLAVLAAVAATTLYAPPLLAAVGF